MYERCVEERAEKLQALKGKVKQTYKKEEDSHRKTKLAYVDVAPKAPRIPQVAYDRTALLSPPSARISTITTNNLTIAELSKID